MKALLLLAVVGFVLSVGYALPFSDGEAQNDELKDITADFEDDFETENPKRYDINSEGTGRMHASLPH